MQTRRPLFARLLFAIPILGAMLREVVDGGEEQLAWFVAALVLLWVTATVLFGYPGLIVGALGFVALAFLLLMLITQG